MRIHVRGGRLVDPANNRDSESDLFIADGNVVGIETPPDGFNADRTIEASDMIVCPGLIDLCAHMREPGAEHKASIASEARAAARGGITTVCYPPNTDPVVDTPAVVKLIRQQAAATQSLRIVTLGALTHGLEGKQLSAMAALKDAGCVGVSNNLAPVANPLIMRRAMEYAATYDLTVFLHPEDHWLRDSGCAHEGTVSTRLGLPGIPAAAETVAVARDLALIQHTGVRAHFCRLSTDQAVRMIARAQYDGLPVSADVAIHHLHLSEIDISDFNGNCHVRPPLRTLRDQQGLREGVNNNTIGAICTDHQPHEDDAKLKPFSETESGISGLETLLPLGLRLVYNDITNLNALIARLTHQPAEILGIDAGRLGLGDRADVCIFDPDAYWELTRSSVVSHGHNSPFFGWQFQGLVMHTLFNGRIVYEHQKEQ